MDYFGLVIGSSLWPSVIENMGSTFKVLKMYSKGVRFKCTNRRDIKTQVLNLEG